MFVVAGERTIPVQNPIEVRIAVAATVVDAKTRAIEERHHPRQGNLHCFVRAAVDLHHRIYLGSRSLR